MSPQTGTASTRKPRKQSVSAKGFSLVSEYPYGYRNKEDVTNLAPGILIVGSQNVIINSSGRVQIRQGYSLDGAVSSANAAILSSFDWRTRGNGERHLRAGFLTSAGNDGKLQYRYVAPATGVVTWRDLLTSLTTVAYNLTTFWDTTESLRVCLFVNGTSNIFEWNGAYTELLSSTANTLTKAGDTWLDTGFYSTGTRSVVINGTTYTYTGGDATTTLTGVTPDPSAEAVGSVVHQSVRTTANSAMTAITATFKNGLISVLNNQIYIGSLTSSVFWLSKVNNYKDYSASTPRQAGEGGSLILDQNLVGFIVQGSETDAMMYISAGKDLWYKITFTNFVSAAGTSGQTLGAVPIKNGKQQGAISQGFMSSMKNNTITVTNESTIDVIGVMENFLTQIQTNNISDPIKIDIDSYDFTNGSIFYFKYNIYVAIPAEETVLIFDVDAQSWESPQTLPITRFYIVDGELYGHSSSSSESYKLFTGYADRVSSEFRGAPIVARWIFSFENYGTRAYRKSANYLYLEGYLNQNTIAIVTLTYELDGCATERTFTIDGSDSQIVCIKPIQGDLGKESLGKQKLGGGGTTSIQNLPPKFRVQKSFNNTDFFECNVVIEVSGTDNRFELIAFGLNAEMATQLPVSIRQ
jgi:hypothetical protein